MAARPGPAALICAALALASCGARDGTPQLMNLRSSTDGPDEFAILPPKGLEMPQDLAALPAPTPGGTNLTDRDPRGDAILALGGKPPKAAAGVPAGDAGLVSYASRFGGTADIRKVLANEDLDWRRRHRGKLMERLFAVNVYYQAYRAMMLDQFQELQYWRARGVPTPSAPPPLNGEN